MWSSSFHGCLLYLYGQQQSKTAHGVLSVKVYENPFTLIVLKTATINNSNFKLKVKVSVLEVNPNLRSSHTLLPLE